MGRGSKRPATHTQQKLSQVPPPPPATPGNSGLKFRKFRVRNGTGHSDCTATQATARLVIVLVSRIQKSGTVKWKGTFRSDRTKWLDRSKWTTFTKLVPNIPVGPNRNGPFHLTPQPKFWVEWKAPMVPTKECLIVRLGLNSLEYQKRSVFTYPRDSFKLILWRQLSF